MHVECWNYMGISFYRSPHTTKKLKSIVTYAYICEFWCKIANILSAFTANVFDNNIQYMLQFTANLVITNCACSIILGKVFNALNYTYGLFGRKLLLIHVSSKYKCLLVYL